MLKSKYTFWVILPVLMVLFVTSFIIFICYLAFFKNNSPDNIQFAVYIFLILFFFIWSWLVFGELRKRIISVIIHSNSISKISYFGLGSKFDYQFSDLQGFFIMKAPSTWATYEYLYIIKSNKKVIILSEFYHKNYHELKIELSKSITPLGEKQFSISEMIRNFY